MAYEEWWDGSKGEGGAGAEAAVDPPRPPTTYQQPVDSPANRLNLTRRRRGHPDLSGRRWLHTFLLARFLHVGSVAVTAEIPSLSASLSSLISYISQTHRLTNK